MLTTLIDAGADVNLKSDWENGPYTVLDNADEDTARFLLAHGATADAERGGAARLARRVADARERPTQRSFTRAEETVSSRCTRRRPSRLPTFCSTTAPTSTCAASITSRRLRSTRSSIAPTSAGVCSSAAPHPTSSWPRASATSRSPTRLLDADPACAAARINEPGYPPVPPFNIYCWSIGFGLSPHDVARSSAIATSATCSWREARRGSGSSTPSGRRRARGERRCSLRIRRSSRRCSARSTATSRRRSSTSASTRPISCSVSASIPAAPGVDGGTALHAACWVGNVRMVERLLARGGVPLDASDPTHQSTPLGWAAFGSVHRRAPGADYPAVVRPARGRRRRHQRRRQRRRPHAAGDGAGQSGDAGGAAASRRRVAPGGSGSGVAQVFQTCARRRARG